MLPLNKPLINFSKNQVDLDEFIVEHFPNRYYHLTFSARQGLSEIYQQIKQEKGPQNVAVSPLTCVEAIYPIIEHGHHVRFVDINPETFNMDEKQIPQNMDIVQAIHLGGNPQDMELIKSTNPKIIVEDCAQGFGSYYKNKPIGLISDFSVFSFMKNVYSLGGGLSISYKEYSFNNSHNQEFSRILTFYRLFKRLLESKSSFKNNLPSLILKYILKLKPENTTPIINNSAINSKIYKSIQTQLSSYQVIIDKRNLNANYLLSNITTEELIPQKINPNGTSNFLRLFFKTKSRNTTEIISFLRSFGIGANHLTQNFINTYQKRFDKNVHLKKYINESSLPCYFDLHDRIVSIPISPALKKNELEYMINILNRI